MTFTRTIELDNVEYSDLCFERDGLETSYNDARRRVEVTEETMSFLLAPRISDETEDRLIQGIGKLLSKEMINADQCPENLYSRIVHSTLNTMLEVPRAYADRLERYSARMTDIAMNLQHTKRRLANMSPDPIVYDIEAILEQINGVDSVLPQSAYMTYSEDEDPYICWATKPLTAKITFNENHFEDLRPPLPLDENGHASLPIGQTLVRLNLNTKGIQIIAAQEQDAHYNYATPNAVHPHVLGEGYPCFGDFGGPITEAIVERDWNSVATYITLFLSRVDPYDAAGEKWVNYFINQLNRESDEITMYAGKQFYDVNYKYTFFFTMDGDQYVWTQEKRSV